MRLDAQCQEAGRFVWPLVAECSVMVVFIPPHIHNAWVSYEPFYGELAAPGSYGPQIVTVCCLVLLTLQGELLIAASVD